MNKQSLQQTYTNSCGAVSLLCAAAELGVQRLSEKQELKVNPFCEADLYENMASAGPNVRKIEVRKERLEASGYIMPAKLAGVARSLGLEVAVYKEPSVTTMVLDFAYPRATGDVSAAGFEVMNAAAPALAEDERALTIVAVKLIGVPAGLHYILRRPDGSCMDPDTGQNYESYAACAKGFVKSYQQTGITLVLKKKL